MTFKYTGGNWADGWECEVETGAQLDIENGGVDEIDLRVKIAWWAQAKQHTDQVRQIDILVFEIHGASMLDKISSIDLRRIEDYCRKVTDYQFQQLEVGEPATRRSR
jgi:hypothetical protein